MRTIIAEETSVLAIGYQEEDSRACVVFSYADLWDEFPNGLVTLEVRRPGERTTYPVDDLLDDRETKHATWIIHDYDLVYKGLGECQFTYVAGAVAKSKIWKTTVDRSLSAGEASPPTWEDWKNQLMEVAAEAASYADLAGESAAGAAEQARYAYDARDAAALAKTNAESARDLAQGYSASAREDADFLRNASAEAVTLAPGSEATASYSDGVFTFGIPPGEVTEQELQDALAFKADKADTVLDTTLSMGRKSGTIVGAHSVAVGDQTTASGFNSHAEGGGTKASGAQAHAEGNGTVASGPNSHAEGGGTVASGENAHAEGVGSVASSENAHAEGCYTIADGSHSHAQGKYNVAPGNQMASVVGNGTGSASRSNAYALDWSGNGHFAGNVYVGCGSDSSGGLKLATLDEVALSAVNISGNKYRLGGNAS